MIKDVCFILTSLITVLSIGIISVKLEISFDVGFFLTILAWLWLHYNWEYIYYGIFGGK